MAGSVNKVTLVGNLGRDPEIRYTQDNKKIVHLSVATSERWRDRGSGETKERTEWHRVVIFNENLADVAERYLAKGRTVYLEGSLQTRKWQDQSGQERYSTEVVIQRFRGDLVLLGGGREGGGEMGPGSDDYGEPPIEGPPSGFGGGGGGGAGGGGARSFQPRGGAPARGGPQGGPGGASGGGAPPRRPAIADDLDDEIPF